MFSIREENPAPIKLLIADDHTLVRQGLRFICEGLGGFKVVAEAESGAQAVALARTTNPDVVLIDAAVPGVDALEATRQITREKPAAGIIVLVMDRQDPHRLEAIRAGARCWLPMTFDARDLIAAIEAVHFGQSLVDPLMATRQPGEPRPAVPVSPLVDSLTAGEMAILRLVAQGANNQDIARRLNYSVYTVANRLRAIYEKLHVDNRTQAALFALRQGWAVLEDVRT